MKILPPFVMLCIFLTSCSKDYPLLSDAPPYTPPSISAEEAQQEIKELAQERGLSRPFQNTKK